MDEALPPFEALLRVVLDERRAPGEVQLAISLAVGDLANATFRFAQRVVRGLDAERLVALLRWGFECVFRRQVAVKLPSWSAALRYDLSLTVYEARTTGRRRDLPEIEQYPDGTALLELLYRQLQY